MKLSRKIIIALLALCLLIFISTADKTIGFFKSDVAKKIGEAILAKPDDIAKLEAPYRYIHQLTVGDILDLLKSKNTPLKQTELNPLIIEPKDLEGYYRVYKNPFVLYLRKALNAYLANDSDEVNISMAAVQKESSEGIISGLDSFNKDYYKGKFIVLTINDGLGGGKDMQIIFQDKPDRIFYAWVYQLADGNYELRGFNSKESSDKKGMEKIIDYYKPYLLDKEHAL